MTAQKASVEKATACGCGLHASRVAVMTAWKALVEKATAYACALLANGEVMMTAETTAAEGSSACHNVVQVWWVSAARGM